MRPPACVRCKWGTGTTCEKQPDTVAAKEVKSSFEKMMAERARQDANWFAPEPLTKVDQTNTASSPSNDPGNTRK
jgi:hypothetical protein